MDTIATRELSRLKVSRNHERSFSPLACRPHSLAPRTTKTLVESILARRGGRELRLPAAPPRRPIPRRRRRLQRDAPGPAAGGVSSARGAGDREASSGHESVAPPPYGAIGRSVWVAEVAGPSGAAGRDFSEESGNLPDGSPRPARRAPPGPGRAEADPMSPSLLPPTGRVEDRRMEPPTKTQHILAIRRGSIPRPAGCVHRSGRTVLDSGAVDRIPCGKDRVQRRRLVVVAPGPVGADVVAQNLADCSGSRAGRDADAARGGAGFDLAERRRLRREAGLGSPPVALGSSRRRLSRVGRAPASPPSTTSRVRPRRGSTRRRSRHHSAPRAPG